MSEEMIHIKEVHIEGYKSILDAKVEFLPGLNVIIGKNGAGKSNLLTALEGLLLGKRRMILSTNVETVVGMSDGQISNLKASSTNGHRSIEYSKGLVFVNSEESMSSYLMDYGTEAGAKEVSELVTIGYSIPTEIPFLGKKFTAKIGLDFKDHDELLKAITDSSIPYFSRAIIAQIFHSLTSPRPLLLDWSKAEEHLPIIVSNSLGLHDASMQSLIDHSPIEDVRLAQDFSFVRLAKTLFQLNNISYEFKIGEEWLPFNDLSDGTQRLVYIIFSFCLPRVFLPIDYGNLYISEKEMPNKVILFEEPEIGIHPHQLYQLLQFLKSQSRKHQIIITTHSPSVLDVIGREELDRIIIASYDDKLGSTFKHLDEDQKSKALAYMEKDFLSDYWRYSDLEPRAKLW